MKKITYTIHALKRMRERRISKEEVMACLERPDKEIVMDHRKKAIKRINKRALTVVYRESQDSAAITTYAVSKEWHL